MNDKDKTNIEVPATENFWKKDTEVFSRQAMHKIRNFEARRVKRKTYFKRSFALVFALAAVLALYVNFGVDQFDGEDELKYIQSIAFEATNYSREDYVDYEF